MQDDFTAPRHPLGLFAIAALLGAPAVMLWMGRFRLALLYLAATLALILCGIALNLNGLLPLAISGLSFSTVMQSHVIIVSVFALFHTLKLNKEDALRPWFSNWYIALPAFHVVFVTLALALRHFIMQPFDAPSPSNHPNLASGDVFYVSKLDYSAHDPVPGQLAVFKLPSNPTIDYVKRVVGAPGDRVQMKAGVLHINGQPVELEEVRLDINLANEDLATARYFRETLSNGASYVVTSLAETSLDNTEEYIVPARHYFALGDNRDNSADSRVMDTVGFIPRENFVGPFMFRFWNNRGVPLHNRPAQVKPSTP